MSRSLLATGLAVLALAWAVLPFAGLPPFATHMGQHMAVVALAAPLLAGAVAGSRFDPVRRAPIATNAIVASMVELVLVWAWHAPALHHFARHALLGRVVEQGSFLFAGLYLWVAALGGGAQRRRQRAVAGVTGLLLTSMHMTLLGALLTLTGRPLYHHAVVTESWLSPTHDQQVGGAIMLLGGGLAYLIGALWLAGSALRPSASREVAS